jgi:glycosyltransferase involved in cell wall biosynthesis
LLFDPGDAEGFVRAVDRLLADAPLRQQMGQAARSHVAKHFDPDVNYTALLDRLVALADERPVSAALIATIPATADASKSRVP